MEEDILRLWKERDVFRKSVAQRQGAKKFILFEGPPTANGSPGIHHVLARVFKDLFPRYKTMQGFQAPRRAGWDTHGLPVELEIEKELKLRSKPDIEQYGIEKFNQKCRESVFRYVKEWESMTERVAYWVDTDNAYVTYRNEYIETGWWIVKKLWDAGLVYQGRRVAPHCPRCGTTLSSHEVALGYKEDTPDPSVYVKFAIAMNAVPEWLRKDLNGKGYLLAWTTTPWTLPGNSALSVNAKETYVVAKVTSSGDRLILARALLGKAIREEHEVLAEFTGADLVGLRYVPLYDPTTHGVDVYRFEQRGSNMLTRVEGPDPHLPGSRQGSSPADGRGEEGRPLTYPVIAADFVSMEDGTGIVHTAPPFGEDDYNVGVANGLYFVQPVKLNGEFEGSYPWTGKFVKKADQPIMDDLKSRGLLLRRETIKHTYPFCWRCDTPLLYYAKSSWYLKTTAVRDRLIEANQAINWVPEHIKSGRFGEWLRNNTDWAISRERYWGTPWPIWQCASCGKQEAIGGVDELRAKPGVAGIHEPLDLHRPYVDNITYACPECKEPMRRVPEVMDAWFDSGAMPLAQWHYPFEHTDLIDSGTWYPADFICEAIDQTRGWFYSLHAIAALLEQATKPEVGSVRGITPHLPGSRQESSPARGEGEKGLAAPSYRNVICLGHILDAKGEKMSKSRGNVVNPWEVINAHGADAIRWYLYSATPPGNSRRFSAQLVAEAVRTFLLTLWNTYSFFVTYANIDGFDPRTSAASTPSELDRWITSRLHTLVANVTAAMDAYDPTTASRKVQAFVDDLSNWYVRRSRRRFWKSENDGDKAAAYRTLYDVLVTLSKLLAPFTPFVAEAMYQNLARRLDSTAPESVHLADYPKAAASKISPDLERAIGLVIDAVSLGRAARNKAKIRVRQPLAKLVVAVRGPAEREALTSGAQQIVEELNVKEVAFADDEGELVSYRVKGNPAKLGPKHGPQMGKVMAAIGKADAKALTAKVRAGASIELDGLALEPGDVDIVSEDKAGYATASDHGLTVAVTTEVSPELALEGLARELVHRIQTMRKAAGFEIADRIVTYYETRDEAVAKAIEAHGAYLSQETLSQRIVRGPAPTGAYTEQQGVEGREVTLAVQRATG